MNSANEAIGMIKVRSNLNCAIIIPTKDRKFDLLEALNSICVQTRKPDQIIIVDSGQIEKLEQEIREVVNGSNIDLIYLRDTPGLAHQRNTGVASVDKDIVCFLDDDVVLESNYIAEIMNVFEGDLGKRIVGVQGKITNFTNLSRASTFFRKLFFLPHHNGFGTLQLSGYPAYLADALEIASVEIMLGCSSYRREVFSEFSFDEALSGASLYEDDDFSYRVSRRFLLANISSARFVHKVTTECRAPDSERWRLRIANHFYLFEKNIPKSFKTIISFIWSDFGYFLLALSDVFRKRSFNTLKGILRGYGTIAKLIVSYNRSKI